MQLNNQWITEEITEEIWKYLEKNEKKKYNDLKPMGQEKCSSKREIYSDTRLPQKTRKISNHLTLPVKQLEKEQTKPKVSRNHKYRKRNKWNQDYHMEYMWN